MANVDRFKGVLSASIDKVNGILASNIDKINGVSLVLRIWRSINDGCPYRSGIAILESDGTAWAWGDNAVGQLGTNNRTSYSSPVSVVGAHLFSSVCTGEAQDASPTYTSRSFGIHASDGSAWGWGANEAGQLGDNTRTSRSSPVSVVRNASYIQVATGYDPTFFLDGATGSLWACGFNGYYALGTNNTTSYSSPRSVYGNRSYLTVSAGWNNGHALDSDGYCYSWGWASVGRLGTGDTSNVATPKRVLGNRVCSYLSEWGESGVQLVTADGSSWVWGLNGEGQLGDGTLTNRTSPVSTLGNRSYREVCASYFATVWIDGDGHMWASGYNGINDRGYLGVGSVGLKESSPMSVLGDIVVEHVSKGSHIAYALEQGGINLWGWGGNNRGQLGTGDTVFKSFPVLVLTPPS